MSLPKEGSRDVDDGIIVSMVPDVCLTPQGFIDLPVPYTIWCRQADAANLANSVRQTDDRSHAIASIVVRCYGDEPGTGGGIHSGTTGAEGTPKTWSQTVRAEGRNMVRHTDQWWMNHRNTYGKLIYTKDMSQSPAPEPEQITPQMTSGDRIGENSLATLPQVAQLAQADADCDCTPLTPFEHGLRDGLALMGARLGNPYKSKDQAVPLTEADIVRISEQQKKCPCTVEKYSVMRKTCPTECPDSQAHHIVADYLLRFGSRKQANSPTSRIYSSDGKSLPSLKDGPAICLIGNAATPGTPHYTAQQWPAAQIGESAAKGNGTVPLGYATDISVVAAVAARPECTVEILRKTYAAFDQYDRDTQVRGTLEKPSGGALNGLLGRPAGPE